MARAHDILLEHLRELLSVQLVARLKDEQAVGNTNEKYLHVFVPDLHLLSEDAQENYRLNFDWIDGFEKVTTALLNTRDHLWDEQLSMKVYQLGDFLDLWREGKKDLIGSYCLCDVLDTYFVFLRSRVLCGEISLEKEHAIQQHAHEIIEDYAFEDPNLEEYLAIWQKHDSNPDK